MGIGNLKILLVRLTYMWYTEYNKSRKPQGLDCGQFLDKTIYGMKWNYGVL